MKKRGNSGFTLVELLVAITLGLVILAGLYQTFRTQHDSYIVQDQVAAMQQNLRAAMYLITRDLQMAGWYTNFDRNNRTIDLGDLGEQTGRPLFFAVNNYDIGDNTIKDGTDALVIVKAAAGDGTDNTISGADTAGGTSIDSGILSLSDFDATTDKKYGLLVKSDLRTADFFILDTAGTTKWALAENYSSGDLVFRADIIIYKIVDEGGRPMLKRKNLGSVDQYHTVAENIDNMQVRYQLNDGSWENTLTPTNQALVRAVEVTLVGRTARPQRGYTDTNTYTFNNDPDATYTANDAFRRKVFSTAVKTRNVGL
jgi:type IV pilus assembly protein PilW